MKNKNHFILIILATIALAAAFGAFIGKETSLFNIPIYLFLDLFGKLFINALMLVVVPLVASSIIIGISKIGKDEAFKRIGSKTLGIFLGFNFIAILVGAIVFRLFIPFLKNQIASNPHLSNQVATLENKALTEPFSFFELIKKIIPSNLFQALSTTEMLGIIFFSLLFGYCLSKSKSESHRIVEQFFNGIFDVMLKITQLIMKTLPIGVFCLVAKSIALSGLDTLKNLSFFGLIVLIATLIHLFVSIPLFLKFFGKASTSKFYKAIFPAITTAFSTTSSSATLPVTLSCLENRAKVSNKIASLVAPLATSLNMSGSALFAYVAAAFIALHYQVDLTFSMQIMLILVTLFASLGIAGVPAAALIGVIIILKSLNIPAESIGIIIAIDRFMDMIRSSANAATGAASAVIIAKSEKETKVLEE